MPRKHGPFFWVEKGKKNDFVFLLFSSLTLFVFPLFSSFPSFSWSLLFPRFDCLLIAHLFVFLLPPLNPPPSFLLLCLSPLDVPPLLTGVVALAGPVLQWQDQLQGNV